MRRFPSSWSTTLTQLGFRRKRNARHQHGERARRPRFEPLEERRMLATFMVNSTADTVATDTELTLREAITAANSDTTPDVITFDPLVFDSQETITLTGGQLTISEDLTIEGPGSDLLSVSGNDASRVFSISDGVEATILDVTITEGLATNSNGGAIFSLGDLRLERVVVSDSVATVTSGSNGWGGRRVQRQGRLDHHRQHDRVQRSLQGGRSR